jgi:hypothetical protein
MKKWSLVRWAIYGALVGIVISVVGPMVTGGSMPSDPTMLFGNLLAGAVVCAIVGVAIAWIRNATTKAT